MNYYGYILTSESDLSHYGLKGMHWGVRRWQNVDGTFNAAGKARYFSSGAGEDYKKLSSKKSSASSGARTTTTSDNASSFDREKARRIAKGVAIGAAVVGGTALAIYGGKKIHDLGGFSKVGQDIVAKAQKNMADVKVKTSNIKHLGDIKKRGALTKTELLAINSGKVDGINIEAARNLADEYLSKEEARVRDILSNPGKYNEKDLHWAIVDINNTRETIAKNLGIAPDLIDEKWDSGKIISNIAKYEGPARNGSLYAQRKVVETVSNTSSLVSKSVKSVPSISESVKSTAKAVTSDQAKAVARKTAETAGKVVKATANGTKTAESIAKSSANVAKFASQHPKETKAAVDYTAQLLRNLGELSAANASQSRSVSSSNSVENYNRQASIRMYKQQHPGTKLSDKEIARNLGY